MPARVCAQLAAERFTPCGEKLGELGPSERLGGLEELVTETGFRKSMGNSRSAARETSLVIITAGEKSDQNEPTTSELDGWVREDVGGGIDGGMVTVHTTVSVLRSMLTVASEIDARARLNIT